MAYSIDLCPWVVFILLENRDSTPLWYTTPRLLGLHVLTLYLGLHILVGSGLHALIFQRFRNPQPNILLDPRPNVLTFHGFRTPLPSFDGFLIYSTQNFMFPSSYWLWTHTHLTVLLERSWFPRPTCIITSNIKIID